MEDLIKLHDLPSGWRLHYLGQEKPSGWWIAQLAYDGGENPDYDDITFVSRTGLTGQKAYDEAILALKKGI